MGLAADIQLNSYAKTHQLVGLTTPSLIALIEERDGYRSGVSRRHGVLRGNAESDEQYAAQGDGDEGEEGLRAEAHALALAAAPISTGPPEPRTGTSSDRCRP